MVPIILLSLVSLTWAIPDLLLDADPFLEPKRNFLSKNILEDESGISENDYRLSTTTVPSKYDLVFNVHRECLEGKSETFEGLVKIVFSVSEPKKNIVLHSALKILNITATAYEDTQSVEVVGYNSKFDTKKLEIHFANTLIVGTVYKLQIYFRGQLNDYDFEGLLRQQYLTNGATEYVVTTNFEPNHAQRAFPCFDEPQYKAIFRLTLIYPSDFLATSNTPIVDSQYNNETNTITTVFEDTPLMSSYLLAFTISKFTCSNTTSNGISYGVCSRRDLASKRGLALEYGVKILNALGKWTQLSYDTLGIKKIDQYAQVSFPGAMENWGIVSYGEPFLLYPYSLYKQTILGTIAHELSHMWFGNYVTTKWWDTTFLNEGFATYFQYFILNEIPELLELEMDKQFIVEKQFLILSIDGYPYSHSLTSNLWPPSKKFDDISYGKGACIIRMVENTIGTEIFKRALQKYLVQRALNWSTPEILWSVFSNEFADGQLTPEIKFLDFVDNWTNRPGYPVVNATVVGSNILLTQQRFLYKGEDNNNTKWYVPVVYTIFNQSDQHTYTIWLTPDSEGVTINNVMNDNTLVIINPDSLGYYRVNYEKVLRDKIIEQLQKDHTKISSLTRAKLINDAFALAKAGFIDTSDALNFSKYLNNEDSFYPWYTVLNEPYFRSQPDQTELLKLVEHLADRVPSTNWNEIDHVTSMKLSMIWTFACSNGYKRCAEESKRLFEEFRNNNISINSNIQKTTYCYGLKNSDNIQRDCDFLNNRLKNTNQLHEQVFITMALTCGQCSNDLSSVPNAEILKTMTSKFTKYPNFSNFQKFGGEWNNLMLN
ncbi:glutamyl aminopeptidase-like [Diabrotica undecimpunctata]|uniref:glutamyl aminopeptidase-like n=1 Tax=Diabrotica undecimpunctata TaxID=50387 RepID=UPI003B633BBB